MDQWPLACSRGGGGDGDGAVVGVDGGVVVGGVVVASNRLRPFA